MALYLSFGGVCSPPHGFPTKHYVSGVRDPELILQLSLPLDLCMTLPSSLGSRAGPGGVAGSRCLHLQLDQALSMSKWQVGGRSSP